MHMLSLILKCVSFVPCRIYASFTKLQSELSHFMQFNAVTPKTGPNLTDMSTINPKYNYLFKLLLMGNLLAAHASFFDSLTTRTQSATPPPSEWTSKSESSNLKARPSNCKSGTQRGRSDSELLHIQLLPRGTWYYRCLWRDGSGVVQQCQTVVKPCSCSPHLYQM